MLWPQIARVIYLNPSYLQGFAIAKIKVQWIRPSTNTTEESPWENVPINDSVESKNNCKNRINASLEIKFAPEQKQFQLTRAFGFCWSKINVQDHISQRGIAICTSSMCPPSDLYLYINVEHRSDILFTLEWCHCVASNISMLSSAPILWSKSFKVEKPTWIALVLFKLKFKCSIKRK